MPNYLAYMFGARGPKDPLPFLMHTKEPIDPRFTPAGWVIEPWTGPGNTTGLAGPNYDGTPGSILAALLYEPVRDNARWKVLKHLIRHNQQLVNGRVLTDRYGTEALRRYRELRGVFDWPCDRQPQARGRGVWDYWIDLDPSQVTWALSQLP